MINIIICGSMDQRVRMIVIKSDLSQLKDLEITIPAQTPKYMTMSIERMNWLKLMDNADIALFLEEPSGYLGESTSYELAYWKHRHPDRPFFIISAREKTGWKPEEEPNKSSEEKEVVYHECKCGCSN